MDCLVLLFWLLFCSVAVCVFLSSNADNLDPIFAALDLFPSAFSGLYKAITRFFYCLWKLSMAQLITSANGFGTLINGSDTISNHWADFKGSRVYRLAGEARLPVSDLRKSIIGSIEQIIACCLAGSHSQCTSTYAELGGQYKQAQQQIHNLAERIQSKDDKIETLNREIDFHVRRHIEPKTTETGGHSYVPSWKPNKPFYPLPGHTKHAYTFDELHDTIDRLRAERDQYRDVEDRQRTHLQAEIQTLRAELDLANEQLLAKYNAIQQSQVYKAKESEVESAKKSEQMFKTLLDDILADLYREEQHANTNGWETKFKFASDLQSFVKDRHFATMLRTAHRAEFDIQDTRSKDVIEERKQSAIRETKIKTDLEKRYRERIDNQKKSISDHETTITMGNAQMQQLQTSFVAANTNGQNLSTEVLQLRQRVMDAETMAANLQALNTKLSQLEEKNSSAGTKATDLEALNTELSELRQKNLDATTHAENLQTRLNARIKNGLDLTARVIQLEKDLQTERARVPSASVVGPDLQSGEAGSNPVVEGKRSYHDDNDPDEDMHHKKRQEATLSLEDELEQDIDNYLNNDPDEESIEETIEDETTGNILFAPMPKSIYKKAFGDR